jgi:multiple sugar transport system substrate-binding protein
MTSRDRQFRIAVRKFGPFESAIRKQWEIFTKSTAWDLTLEAETFDLHPLYESLFEHKGLLLGEWDIAFMSTDWVAAANEAKCVVDLSELLRSDPPPNYPDGWTESLLRIQKIGDAVLGIPYHNGPECLLVRKDLFDDVTEQQAYEDMYGASLTIPTTWKEFHQIARFFHRPERGIYGTAFAAYPDGHNTVYDFLLQLWSRGGELIDADGMLRFDSPQAIEALTFYREVLNDPTAIHPACRQMDSVRSGIAFAAGEIAMMVNWFGFGAMAETLENSRIRGCVDITAVPSGEGGRPVSLNSYWLLVIGKGSPHRDIAYKFIKHCLSSVMDKLLTVEGAIGCRKSTWRDPEIQAVVPAYSRLEELHSIARELPRRSDWPKIAARIDDVMLNVVNSEEPIHLIAKRANASEEPAHLLA